MKNMKTLVITNWLSTNMDIKEIEIALQELKEAMIENLEASQAEENVKLRRIKARYNLLKAQEKVRDINYEIVKNEV